MMKRGPTNTFTVQADRARQGFSLAETLIALLIVLLVSIIVATGVPSAINAYHNAVAGSNAQVALSTVATALRDELGSATEVTVDGNGNMTAYLCGEGYWATITIGTNDKVPMKKPADARLAAAENNKSWSLVPAAQLSATQGDLYSSYESIKYADNVFTVNKLLIKDGHNKELVKIDSLKIRAAYCKVVPSKTDGSTAG